MRLDRRGFLAGAAAVAAVGRRGATAAEETETTLRAAPATLRLAPQGWPETEIWAYDGVAPGPAIRTRQGGRVVRRFVNALPQPSAVHWHGIRLANAMDGVPHLTQDSVLPGAEFLYDFETRDAGTFWYHSHDRSWEQVARGLHGPLIVDEIAPPDVDADETLTLDDWRLTDEAAVAGGFDSMHDRAHAGRLGNLVTVNGLPEARLAARRGDRLRLRLINAANARIFEIRALGHEAWLMALDGHPLATPERMDSLTLAPAQRADLFLDVGDADEGMLASIEREGVFALATVAAVGPRMARRSTPASLPQNPVPPLGDLRDAIRVRLVMEGGAHGGMTHATHSGERLDLRELVGRGQAWAFNGVAGMGEAPLLGASLGETVRLALVNDTDWPHAIHLHGHHFRRVDGAFPGPLRDTILVGRRETAEIAFVADNPGDWMLHCHMLEHAAGGMMSWIRVG